MTSKRPAQTIITRIPYALEYDPQPILDASKEVDERGLIFVSIPIHVDSPNNGGVLIDKLEKAGLFLVAKVCWYRDRHVVTKNRRLTNTWEPIAIFSKAKNYIINRDAPSKLKQGFEARDTAFDEEQFLTCIGDHWPVRNDRSDRRFLPQTVVLNCAQLADLEPEDTIIDLYGNPGVKKACEVFNWEYKDLGLASEFRGKKSFNDDSSEGDDENDN
jgi:hypothetical protein